ncbi:MAG: sulfatase-like hydrolase/transferase, partial [Phaeodactylibacter sp.]|nr:sulfatase-like hydrolase/transferase [Phaeodactylibacter sp.]
DWPQIAKNYAAMITRMDGDVGKIMKLLKKLGIDENTLVIFTSDNGPYTGVPTPIEFFDSNGPFKGGKRDLYEGGIRVPFIARWKNVIPAGAVNSKMIAFWDMLPTFTDILSLPAERETDGISILPDIKGGKGKEHKFLYWDYGHVRPTFKQAIRSGNYKGILIESDKRSRFELYNLEEGPGEEHNIAEQHPDVVSGLREMMKKAYRPTDDYPLRGSAIDGQGNNGFPQVPGVVVNHEPASSGVYVGAPSIAILPGGEYVMSHNFTSIENGDRGKVHKTAIFRSEDKGLSWAFLTEIENQRWSTLFYHRGALYLIGVYEAFGNAIIRKSVDGGKTWTSPKDERSGLLAKGRYHCAPVPVIYHNGRIWRAMEDAPEGRQFRALMMSAPEDADLLRADSWTFSNKLPYKESWHNGKMKGWLEGNAVVGPDNEIVNVLRCEFTDDTYGTAAIARISHEGDTIAFNPEEGYCRLPGGTSKKFTIRYDPDSRKYWALVNWIQPCDMKYLEKGEGPGRMRNTLALASSPDLRNWIIERVILYHPDIKKHAFQYVDWQFDGDDIVAVSRTAYDDGMGGADSYHNANFITFHRVKDFRDNLNFGPSWKKK